MIHDILFPSLIPFRTAINSAYLLDEAEHLNTLLTLIRLGERKQAQIEVLARQLASKVRHREQTRNGIDALLHTGLIRPV